MTRPIVHILEILLLFRTLPCKHQVHQGPFSIHVKGDGALAAATGSNVAKSDGKLEGEGVKVRKISKRVSKTVTLMVSTAQIKSRPQTQTQAKVADAQTGVSTHAKWKCNGTNIGNEGPQKKRRASVKK
jgi:hypothetical protein